MPRLIAPYGGGSDGGGDGHVTKRGPQSPQSLPIKQISYSLPSPPSSQEASSLYDLSSNPAGLFLLIIGIVQLSLHRFSLGRAGGGGKEGGCRGGGACGGGGEGGGGEGGGEGGGGKTGDGGGLCRRQTHETNDVELTAVV